MITWFEQLIGIVTLVVGAFLMGVELGGSIND